MLESRQIREIKTVLVVDDQEVNRDVLGAILEDDYHVLYAENGAEAIERIREYMNTLSIVLLDLYMPVMNGFEVLERMKEDDMMSRIPVIVLTSEKTAELKALQMGAADFITKPLDMHEVILARVGRIIELSEGKKLISAAEHDRLTGLYTKNFFFEYAERILRVVKDCTYDAVVVNIQQFHMINELKGRKFGDQVLCAVAQEIREFLNRTGGIASRLEADRFYIFCEHQEDYGALLSRLEQSANSQGEGTVIRLRMGVNVFQEGDTPVLMFDHARTACNLSRGNFQTPLVFYDDELRNREILHQKLLYGLEAALEEGQFQVYYQPKYNIQTDPPRLVSAEALVRWKHPELGMVSPGEFIPLFERKGVISEVDNYVWQTAAKDVRKWREQYGFALPVSVNLSRTDMFDTTLPARLNRLILNNGLNYSDIKLEVTETAYTDDADHVLEVISGLRGQGFEIEMDDFGSGYSSLNMLSEMPIDVLKMDMKFVRNIEMSETDFRLVKLIIDIAKYLRLKVVAEGVETEGQLSLLKNAGCDLVQGYYFSRPVPADEFEEMIRKDLALERK